MNQQSVRSSDSAPPILEDSRRRQLVEVTIDSLAELGYVGSTLAQIAGRAGVSPGLVAHYFGDKDGLLDAAFRTLTRRVFDQVRVRLRQVSTPRGRIQAVIDANLSPAEFSQRTGTAWLAFWGQVLRVPSLRRVQVAYQRRTLSNLRAALKHVLPADEAQSLAAMIAAMIDGVWLRAALSGWHEADSESARALLTQFVDGRLAATAAALSDAAATPRAGAAAPAGQRFASVDPATGAVLGFFTAADAGALDAAVRAAQRGQRDWGVLAGAERAHVLRRAAELLRARRAELAELETRDTGTPLRMTLGMGIPGAAQCLEYGASLAHLASGEHIDLGKRAFAYTRREPLGVVAGIGGWHQPLRSACGQAGPALAAGNAMIFKPTALAPLTAVKLEEIFLEAGLPTGVFQVVQGFADTGRLLARHPHVRVVPPAGDDGLRGADATGALEQVPLAVGGRPLLLVFEDAALDAAVDLTGHLFAKVDCADHGTPYGARVFVHSSIMAAFVARLVTRVRAIHVGDPLDPTSDLGPLASAAHLRAVLRHIELGRSEGARLLVGGQRLTGGAFDRGWFVAPAVLGGCRDDMQVVHEPIAAPVWTVLEFDDERQLIGRANAMEAGPVGVFTHDLTRAQRVVAQLQAPLCSINDCNVMPAELNGRSASEPYTWIKRVYVALGDA